MYMHIVVYRESERELFSVVSYTGYLSFLEVRMALGVKSYMLKPLIHRTTKLDEETKNNKKTLFFFIILKHPKP